VQSTNRSRWKCAEGHNKLQSSSLAKPLRLVFDTAALRGRTNDAPAVNDAAPTELAVLCVWFYKDSAPDGATL
jgi:hypothetical protein